MQSYGIQVPFALALFIVGLIFLLVWAILYSNRLANELSIEWWIWLFLGLGLFFILVGLIWLIILQYLVTAKARELYERVHLYEEKYSITDGGVKKVEKIEVRSPPIPQQYTRTEFSRQ